MVVVAAMIDDSRLRDRLAQQISGHAQVVFCTTRKELLDFLGRSDTAALVCQLQDRRHQSVAPLVRTIRQRHPLLPVVAIVRTDVSSDVREIVLAVRAGMNDVVVDREDAWDVVRALVRRGRLDCGAMTVIRAVSKYMPSHARPLVEQYFWSVSPRLNVQQVAAVFGVSRRTLAREHERYGLPQPSTLVAWSRILVAACLLGTPQHSIEKTARLVGFASASALSRATQRYASVRPSDLRRRNAFELLLRRFGSAMKRPRSGSTADARP